MNPAPMPWILWGAGFRSCPASFCEMTALFAGSTAALDTRPLFDLILANLIPAEADPLLDDVRALLVPRGLLLLSGLMADQRAASEAELARHGFTVVKARELEEWVGLVCTAGVRKDRPDPAPAQ